MRHPLKDEALADVGKGGASDERPLRNLCFLPPPLRAVGEQIPRVARAHRGAGERERHAACVDGDPPPLRLLSDGRGA